ncbi:hypothetical protein [Pseudoduganella armeniaca]|nr:hypothetical protein [Pseudoduganella armeniaca]
MTTNAILLAQADTDPGFKVPGAKDQKDATSAATPAARAATAR